MGTLRTPVSICVHRQIPQKLVRSAMGDEGILDYWRPFHIWALVCDLCASQRMVKRVGMSLECYHKLIEYNLTDYTYTGILYDPKPKMEAATYVESLYLL